MLINVSKGETNTSKWRSSLIHGTAGFIGNMVSGIFYPLELLKLRMQVEEKHTKLRQVGRDIYEKEGLRGFYRGFYYSMFASGLSNLLFFSL